MRYIPDDSSYIWTDWPFWVNYALKSVARENFSEFNPATVEKISKSFHAHDLLKSVVKKRRSSHSSTRTHEINLENKRVAKKRRGGKNLTPPLLLVFSVTLLSTFSHRIQAHSPLRMYFPFSLTKM